MAGPLSRNIFTIYGFDYFITGSQSPNSQYMVSDMTVLSGKPKRGSDQTRDLLMEPPVVEKYMPLIVVITKDALQGESGVRIGTRKKDRGQTRRGAGWRWKKLECVRRHVQ